MRLPFPPHIRHASDAVRFVCDVLSSRAVDNFIHTEADVVTVDVKGISCSVEVDFNTYHVLFNPISVK